MDDTPSALAAQRLRLLRFYLPRLLAPDAPAGEEQWLQARTLQQLGEAVWEESGEGARDALVQARLMRLANCITAQMGLPKPRREVGTNGPAWQRVQSHLRQTMPAVEARLRAQLPPEEAESAP